MPKTFGTKVKYEGITFDSKFECRVYKALRLFWEKDEIFCHQPFYATAHQGHVADSRYRNLVKPKAVRFDFMIPDVALIIEAKGRWMPEDYWKIANCLRGLPKTQNFKVIQCNKPPASWFNEASSEYERMFLPQTNFFKMAKSANEKSEMLSFFNVNSQFEDKK